MLYIGPAIDRGTSLLDLIESLEIELYDTCLDSGIGFGYSIGCRLAFGGIAASEDEELGVGGGDVLDEECVKTIRWGAGGEDDLALHLISMVFLPYISS